MGRATGVAAFVLAVLLGALGGLWAFMKAAGAEVDYCRGGGCTSGWYVVALLLGLAVLAAVVALGLLRGKRNGSRPR